MGGKTLDDKELLQLLLQNETKLSAKYPDPVIRHHEVYIKTMKDLGYSGFSTVDFFGDKRLRPDVQSRIEDLLPEIYRANDLTEEPPHAGIFLFQGFIGVVRIPHMVGIVKIRPLDLVNFSDLQIEMLRRNKKQFSDYVDTFSDIFDFAACLIPFEDFQHPQTIKSRKYFVNSAGHFRSATAALSSILGINGATQSALIGAELALKASLLNLGVKEQDLKSLSHDLAKLYKLLVQKASISEKSTIITAIESLPKYVQNRYETNQPSKVIVADIVVKSQTIAGEAARAITKNSYRTLIAKNGVTPL